MKPPGPRRTKVFVSYSHKDKGWIEPLRDHLAGLGEDAVWIDTDAIDAGEKWDQEIEQGLETARVAVLLISAPFLASRYIKEKELPYLLAAAENKQVTLLPIYLLPCIVPPALAAYQAINSPDRTLADLQDEPAEQARVWVKAGKEIRKILAELGPAVPVAPPRATSTQPAAEPAPTVEPLIEGIVERLAFENLSLFLGSDLAAIDPAEPESDEKLPLRLHELTRGLLEDLDLAAASAERFLLPLDVAGTYFALRTGDRGLDSRLCDMVSQRRRLTATHRALARLLRTLGDLETAGRFARRGQRPARLVVTTNVDLLMERALLLAEVPFVRLVQDRSGEKIVVNVYESVVPAGADRLLVRTGEEERDLRRNDVDEICAAIEELGRNEHDYRGGAGRQSAPETAQNPLRTLSFEPFKPQVFLYKFHGSEDVRNSCTISIDQHLRLIKAVLERNVVPLKIGELLASGPVLAFGYGLLDPPFRVLLHTLLFGAASERSENARHYLLQLPPREDDADDFRRLEQRLWLKIKEQAGRYGLKVLEQRGDAFLDELSRALKARWGG